MKVASLAPGELARRLASPCGLRLHTGPFVFALRSPLPQVREGIALLYGDHPLAGSEAFTDFDVEIAPGGGVRRWLRPLSRFVFDGRPVFDPMPASHAYPLLEWAMNWCISALDLHHLTLHAAVLERDGKALILPAPPGSGKSTLCAGLMHTGWRLLSDELTLIDLQAPHAITPLCRPVSLKNTSIDVIARFSGGQAVFNRITHHTIKGSVSHMRVPAEHLARVGETAQARWVVFPRWVAGAPAQMTPRSRAGSLVEVARNAFNYLPLGEVGFQVLADVIEGCDCLDFSYSDLHEAAAVFDDLVLRDRQPSPVAAEVSA
jgi:HprK-related kinase A